MAIGWFIVPYKRRISNRPIRYCAMDDYTTQLEQYNGIWSETEILGNVAIVKVRGPITALTQLAAIENFYRLPVDRLDDPLATLSIAAKTKLKNFALGLGYTISELNARFPNNLGTYTLRDVLQFLATRRLKPRYDRDTDEIILDGETQECRSIESVDAEVVE